ncbi:hypothetical protein L3Q65_45880 [Amycolatopsis sp. FU40]|uniref:hypothetical protein n=1 Tax=Amycolatopsis sp. FU40 TaxID=2914159 RepID=UPI001F2B4281|nr:hypothetical protein [Amycolatopsis sp. FU40]UKD55105.1 hypothetical protein L3Q65_45880 [Amycolatopsis sp. FU40]
MMGKLGRILRQELGEDRTEQQKRTSEYQRAEGMTTPGSSITRRAEQRKAGNGEDKPK